MKHTENIAFLGPQGSYSHIASEQYANTRQLNNIGEYSCQNFSDIIKLVTTKQAKYGILPIENSTSGAIHEVYNLLQNTILFLIGEIHIPIIHCILTIPNASFKEIKKIYSHPEPFQQCNEFFKNFPKLDFIFCKSSADAMEKVSKLKNPSFAALGNENSGKYLYGLQVIKKNIANKKNNTTRFIILGNKKITINKNTPAKTTLILSTDHPSNISIEEISHILNQYNIKIHHIKPQSIKNNTNEQKIFIDMQANLYQQYVQEAVKKLRNITHSLKILGCYPISIQE
ncbi:prephenate dehydratase domain-containing protein [Blochmannia endosymbiont of Polyrhachis (Hedomyrma) turneri]|uniref:prephenate dehydratase domain-containing protein n=1 Tax=Blochmannia endosymbiont of Polyrhachis (Hedomyrma) turneri TaxID=1505596 RepID=UPI00061A63B5|nr:prephenate dehydratase domain-containing protein [Blochmannia endosymbiont of Polyrhachis (Hedomyrma) turneri]AKC59761.1 P-protein [Blochmannia endosymbiont of Polyrhachis (Hedomyrma) turneri]